MFRVPTFSQYSQFMPQESMPGIGVPGLGNIMSVPGRIQGLYKNKEDEAFNRYMASLQGTAEEPMPEQPDVFDKKHVIPLILGELISRSVGGEGVLGSYLGARGEKNQRDMTNKMAVRQQKMNQARLASEIERLKLSKVSGDREDFDRRFDRAERMGAARLQEKQEQANEARRALISRLGQAHTRFNSSDDETEIRLSGSVLNSLGRELNMPEYMVSDESLNSRISGVRKKILDADSDRFSRSVTATAQAYGGLSAAQSKAFNEQRKELLKRGADPATLIPVNEGNTLAGDRYDRDIEAQEFSQRMREKELELSQSRFNLEDSSPSGQATKQKQKVFAAIDKEIRDARRAWEVGTRGRKLDDPEKEAARLRKIGDVLLTYQYLKREKDRMLGTNLEDSYYQRLYPDGKVVRDGPIEITIPGMDGSKAMMRGNITPDGVRSTNATPKKSGLVFKNGVWEREGKP